MMTGTIVYAIPQRVKALYTLIRVVPVLSWGISSSLVGLGFAYTENKNISWITYSLILLLITLIHGVVSHAYNDREDWLSGTDQQSPGILSGGSGVVAQGQYSPGDLLWVGRAALLLVLLIAGYFLWRFGPTIMILLAVAVWSALAYSCAPLRLAYHPLTGEWLCAFPAVFASVVGTFYVLTGTLKPVVLVAGGIHALLAIGLLMHHHISDISSDLQATPCKLTTVALVGSTLGMQSTPLVELLYFLLALLLGVVGGIFFHPVFWITVPTALGCMAAALTTIPEDIISITNKEYLLYWLIISDAVVKMLWLV
ncbi:MAG TPA: prenyltransferase [Syntrophomonas sp.]|nr:prenyltransferase [Syntrophomonas sp.]